MFEGDGFVLGRLVLHEKVSERDVALESINRSRTGVCTTSNSLSSLFLCSLSMLMILLLSVKYGHLLYDGVVGINRKNRNFIQNACQ